MSLAPVRPLPWLLLAVLAWCVGSVVQLQLAALPRPDWLTALAAAGVLAAWLGHRLARLNTQGVVRWASAALWLAAWVALAFCTVSWRAEARLAERLPAHLEGQDLTIVGVVASMPQAFSGTAAGGMRFAFEPDSQNAASPALPPKLWLSWYAGLANGELNGLPDLKVGERWRLTVRLKRPHGSANPHGFDYELWLFEHGYGATGYVRARPAAERLGTAWTAPRLIERARQATRDAIFAQVGDGEAGDQAAGVLAALVAGDQRAIDRAEWDLFRATGVAHLMSISGLHVTMFAWLAAVVVGWAWRRSTALCLRVPAPSAARLGGFGLALAYAVFSGFGVPAQRTVWMVGTVTLIGLLGLRWQAWRVLLASGFVVVATDPWALLQPGFWLSFVAVAMLFASGTQSAEASRLEVGDKAKHLAKRLAREQWVATLALAPLSLLFFQQVSVLGLVANAVAIPLVTLLITPLAMLGALVPLCWTAAAVLTQGLLWALQALANVGTALGAGPLSLPAPGLAATLFAMLGVALLVVRLPWALRLLALPLLLPLVSPVLAPTAWAKATRPPTGQFELLAADVGQGTAVLIRTASHTWLYDAGPRYSAEADAGDRVLVPLLRALGERRLDGLVISHRDADHAGGAASLLKAYPGTPVLTSVAVTEVQGWTSGQPVPVTRCEAGQRWQADGVRFEVLHPPAASYEQANVKPNALSCVLRVVAAGEQAALLTGDLERLQELALVSSGLPLSAAVLMVPHHGSKTSSTAELLAAVSPQVAVAQAGYRNRFGHPAAEVLARYAAAGIEVKQSAQCGAWRWASGAAPRPAAREALGQARVGRCWRVDQAHYWNFQK